jgi:hypothetical protein
MTIRKLIRSGNLLHMETVNKTISACRHCQFYVSEGRRGGHCQQLGVPVQSSWKSCSLASSPFVPNWDLPGIAASWPGITGDPQPATPDLSLTLIALAESQVEETAA